MEKPKKNIQKSDFHNAQTQGTASLQGSRHRAPAVDGMVRRVVEASEAREAISIGTLVFGTTLNSLSNTIFSVDIFYPKSNAIQELKELIWSIMELGGKPNLSDFFPLLKPFDLQGIRRSTKVPYELRSTAWVD